jgi:hypothetical protein
MVFFREVTCAIPGRTAVPHFKGGNAAPVQSQWLIFES